MGQLEQFGINRVKHHDHDGRPNKGTKKGFQQGKKEAQKTDEQDEKRDDENILAANSEFVFQVLSPGLSLFYMKQLQEGQGRGFIFTPIFGNENP